MASRSRVSPSEKGPVGSGGSPPRQRQAHGVKSPFLSGVLCVTSPPAGWVSNESPRMWHAGLGGHNTS